MKSLLELSTGQSRVKSRKFFHAGLKSDVVKIFPGEVYVTSEKELIATGLGSCISVCMWDPFLSVGGMNHFMLPLAKDGETASPSLMSSSARFGNYAMELLINALLKEGAIKSRLKIKVFGGGNMMGKESALPNMINIGDQNIAFIKRYLLNEKFNVVSEDLGGFQPRRLMFDPVTGKAWVKKLHSKVQSFAKKDTEYQRNLVNQNSSSSSEAELF